MGTPDVGDIGHPLCRVCGITPRDTLKPSAKWAARHKKHRQRQKRMNPGRNPTPNCEWAREANRLYLADYHGRSREPRCMNPEQRDGWITQQSVCDECGITAADTSGQRWARRHQIIGSEPCEPSRLARNAHRSLPRERKKQRERESRRRQAAVARRLAGDMPDEWHGTHWGKTANCGCDLCKQYRAERSREERQRRKEEAKMRRAAMDAAIDASGGVELDDDGLDEEERELERRLAS